MRLQPYTYGANELQRISPNRLETVRDTAFATTGQKGELEGSCIWSCFCKYNSFLAVAAAVSLAVAATPTAMGPAQSGVNID